MVECRMDKRTEWILLSSATLKRLPTVPINIYQLIELRHHLKETSVGLINQILISLRTLSLSSLQILVCSVISDPAVTSTDGSESVRSCTIRVFNYCLVSRNLNFEVCLWGRGLNWIFCIEQAHLFPVIAFFLHWINSKTDRKSGWKSE